MSRNRILGLVVAVLMVLVGVLWTFQGLGYVEGSTMTGADAWAMIGPALAGLGVALGIVMVRGSR